MLFLLSQHALHYHYVKAGLAEVCIGLDLCQLLVGERGLRLHDIYCFFNTHLVYKTQKFPKRVCF